VPDEDEGYFIVIIQAPAGSSLEYTTNIAKQAEQVIMNQPEVMAVFSVGGFSFSGSAPNQGMMFAGCGLRGQGRKGRRTRWPRCSARCAGSDRRDRRRAGDSDWPRRRFRACRSSAVSSSKCSTDRAQDISNLANATYAMMGKGNQSGRVTGLYSSFHGQRSPAGRRDRSRSRARAELPIRGNHGCAGRVARVELCE
jgi:multidrug efflux pump subunit AcrB